MKRKNLIKFRVDLGISSKEMADKLELSSAYYSLIENGYRDPSYKMLERFGEVFKDKYDDIWLLFKKC